MTSRSVSATSTVDIEITMSAASDIHANLMG